MATELLPEVREDHQQEDQDQSSQKALPPWNVVLLDDDDHTYDYVIEMLQRLFGHPRQLAYLMAVEVDTVGRVIVLTTSRERAELERDRIHAYGADPRLSRCKGSMSAIIEPASG
ncbi:MAG: ATP-dependent Clp protease adaptor ClpS [Armatimonadetes bacterium]|nr:ATP-dependent Clp protease adaptor ClpS [Armatimonadota bacterium]